MDHTILDTHLPDFRVRKSLSRRPRDLTPQHSSPEPHDDISVDRIIRVSELVGLFSISRSTVYAWIKAGLLPPAMKLGPRIVGWPLSTIKAFLAARASEGDDAE